MPPKIQSTNAQIFKAFWEGVKPHAGLFFLTTLLYATTSVIAVIVPLFYKDFFDILESATDKNLAAVSLIKIIATIFLIYMGQWAIYRVSTFIFLFVESETMSNLRQNAFTKLMPHSHGFFANNFAGSFVQKIGRFARAFERVYDTLCFQIIPLTIMVIGAIIVTFRITPIISLVIMIWVVVFFLFNFFYSKMTVKYSVASAAADSKTGAVLSDAVGNHSAITNFVGFDFENKNFRAITEEQATKTRKSWNMHEIATMIQSFLMIVVEFAVFYFAVRFWQQDQMTVGTFVLIQTYIIGVAYQLWGINKIIRSFYESIADSREMMEIMLTPYEIVDASDLKELEIKKAEIELKNVSFKYSSINKEVLSGVNLSIVSGEKIALIGPSGAGKTTVTRLILRLHNATGGAIFIDGQDISQVTQESLRKNISLVPQDPVLFHRSLMENIRYGRRDATDEEVMQASKLAHCDEFIDSLPNKYETLVGERGVKLSGGERQRVAIARAILKDAPILILDEATSSLDSHSEALIQEALDTLMRGRTTIVIAHRLSTIRKMDRIIVMEHGRIREEGTHAVLSKDESSLYKKLWDLQVSGFIVQ